MDPSDQQSKPSVSLYVKGLDREARDRYRSKLQFEKKTRSLPDPFGIPHLKWENDPTKWPCLEFAQVFVYLIETPALYNTTTMKNYKSLEAYRYVVSGHVQEVLFFDVKDSPFCFLKAGVLPSMRTRDDPHDAWVCLSKDLADVYCAHCTCMAGLGETCSHVAAVLFKIELGVRYGLTQTSVTSEGCKWNQLFKKQVNPSTIQDMQHIMNTNRKKTVESVIPTGKDPLPNHDVLLSLYKNYLLQRIDE